MNFIKSLQQEKAELQNKLANQENALREFLGFLCTAKFSGTDSQGNRKDWISTSDVDLRIREILSER